MKNAFSLVFVIIAVMAALAALALMIKELWLRPLLLPEEKASRRRQLAWRGALLFAIAIASLAIAFAIFWFPPSP